MFFRRFYVAAILILVLCASILILSADRGEAAVIIVDPDGVYSKIQLGLDAAASGDTVQVVAAIYTGDGNTDLDFGGKDLWLVAIDGPEATVIDGGDVAGGFKFHSTESNAAIVEGFAITNAPIGSPIRIENGSSPTFRNCVVQNNHVADNSGGAVLILDSDPVFEDCLIVENTTAFHGGGVAVIGGSPAFLRCVVIGNRADRRGGGLWFDALATPTVESCTIAGNRADEGQLGFDGGGVIVTGGAAAVVDKSIIWGNRGNLGDDLFVAGGSAASFTCSDVDASGVGGGGQIVFVPGCISAEPHFAQPLYCLDFPWSEGDYRLVSTSPCLPPNNDCGVQMGALGEVSGSVKAWTGAGETDDWSDPLNWSGGTLPGPGDFVQLTRGNVVLSTEESIDVMTQCSEDAEPDTLRFVTGSLLHTGIVNGPPDKANPDRSTIAENVDYDDGEADMKAPKRVAGPGRINIRKVLLYGPGKIENFGSITVDGGGSGTVNNNLVNGERGGGKRRGSSARNRQPAVIEVRNGTLAVNATLTNYGQVTVDAGSALAVAGSLVNQSDGTVSLVGDLTGTGSINNLGLVERDGPGVTTIAPELFNDRIIASGEVGSLVVQGGALVATGPLNNRGEVTVMPGAGLGSDGTIENRAPGVVNLRGDLLGSGTLVNRGLLQRVGPGASSAALQIRNRFDVGTGDRGVTRVLGGILNTATFLNEGQLTTAVDATFSASGLLANGFQGEISGQGIVDVGGAVFVHNGSVSPGASPGVLSFVGDFAAEPDAALRIEIAGRTAGDEYDRLAVTGTSSYGGALHVRLTDGFVPAAGDTFTIVTVASAAAPLLDRRQEGFDCYVGTQLADDLFLEPIALPDRFLLVARDSVATNQPPVAVPDTFVVARDTAATLLPLANDYDPDSGDVLTLVRLITTGTLGVAYLDSGRTTVTYVPPPQFIGTDGFVYVTTDCRGATATASVTIEVSETTAIDELPIVPAGYRLHPCIPNPFNPQTTIRFDLPEASRVRLAIYDLRGRRIRVLADENRPAGTYAVTWRGHDQEGRTVPSGVYFVRLQTPRFATTRKMVLLR